MSLAYSGAVTNNSTVTYAQSPPICQWATVPYQRVTAAFTVEAACFHRAAYEGRPVYSVVFGCTDGTNTATSTSTIPIISAASSQYNDQHPVLVYAGNFNASTFIQGDTIICTSLPTHG